MDTNVECKKQIFKFQKKIGWKEKKEFTVSKIPKTKTICTHKPLNSTKFIVFFITMESYDKNENGYSLMDFQPYFVIWSKCTPNDFFSNWTQIKKKYLCDTININILCIYPLLREYGALKKDRYECRHFFLIRNIINLWF